MLTFKHASDPAAFARELLDFEPDPVQEQLLRTLFNRVILNCRRQWGKSSAAAIRAVHLALSQPNQTIVLISITMRQSRELASKCRRFARKLGLKLKTDGTNARSIVFPNGSIILPLPAHEDYVRGFTAHMLIIDEAARVDDKVIDAATPMLATTGGALWLLSTPNGRTGMFSDVWHAADQPDDRWLRIEGKASDHSGAKVAPNFFTVEKRNKTNEVYGAEHECQFTSTDRNVFSEDHIERAFCPNIPIFDELSQTSLQFVKHRPIYYIGLDLAGIGDYAALVMVEYQPQHRDEMDLLREAVYAKYRQERVWHAETGQIEIAIAQNEQELQRSLPKAGPSAHLANGFAHSESMVKLYLRYDSQLHRHFKSCIQQLNDLQDRRRDQPPAPFEPMPHTNPDRQVEVQAGHAPPIEPNEPTEVMSTAREAAAPAEPAAATPIEANQSPAREQRDKAIATTPIEPKTDAQLFEEHRERLLARFYPTTAPHQQIP